MDILLCGARDLREVASTFEDVVKGFGCTPCHFLNSNLGSASNFKDWKTNSEDSVLDADMIVYVIVKEYGAITWNNEYVAGRKYGKPFLFMVYDDTFTTYDVHRRSGTNLKKLADPKEAKLMTTMDDVFKSEPTIIRYTHADFGPKLTLHLSKCFSEGVRLIEKNYKNKTRNSLLKASKFKDLKERLSKFNERNDFMEELADPFEHKEIRKKMIDYFVFDKGLSDETLIELFHDSEQGLYRKAIKTLPKLLTEDNDIDVLFKALIDAVNDLDDTGTTRRAVIAMLEVDFEKAIPYIEQIFPVSDIGVPKRIQAFVEDNLDKIVSELGYTKADKIIKELVNRTENYSVGKGGTLEDSKTRILDQLAKAKKGKGK